VEEQYLRVTRLTAAVRTNEHVWCTAWKYLLFGLVSAHTGRTAWLAVISRVKYARWIEAVAKAAYLVC